MGTRVICTREEAVKKATSYSARKIEKGYNHSLAGEKFGTMCEES